MAGRLFALLTLIALLALDSSAQGDEPQATATDQKYDLVYRFHPGEAVRTKVVHRATIETTIKGTSQTAETRTTSVKLWNFTAGASSDQWKLVHSLESIDMWQRMQGRQEVKYNSLTDEEAPPGYEDMAKAVAVSLTEVTVNNRGVISSRKELHAQSDANPLPLVMPLPAEPVAVGHEWNNPVSLKVLLQSGSPKVIEARQKFTLEKVTSGIATIQCEGQTLTPVHDPAIEAQLIQRLPSGTIRFDIEAGRVISQEMDVDKRVIGFNGPASSMHYLSRFSEEALPTVPAAAKPVTKPTAATKPTPPKSSIKVGTMPGRTKGKR
jgi:hypothetical protein